MKNKQKKPQKSYLYIILLALAFIILLGTGAYAYYQTTISGTISGNVAKWSFKANNQTSTFNFDLGSLYPGKYAEYSLELSAEDSDLPVAFEIICHWDEIEDFSFAAQFLISPKLNALNGSLFFKKNNQYVSSAFYSPGLKGVIMPGKKVTIPLYYNWPYNNTPTDDKPFLDLSGESVTMPVTIIGRQADISSEESSINSVISTDLLGLNTTCTNGTYSYPNKYGIPCDYYSFNFDMESSRVSASSNETTSIKLSNGSTMEIPNYMIYSIDLVY
ncbi:MAG: hypothetical protein IJB71_02160 [Bacilli bacterium]|nr:hypothetical protein [Bacilli bacterium]